MAQNVDALPAAVYICCNTDQQAYLPVRQQHVLNLAVIASPQPQYSFHISAFGCRIYKQNSISK